VDRPTDAENSQSGEQELVSDAESLAVEVVIGIAIGVLAIAVIGLRLRKRRRREMEDVIIRYVGAEPNQLDCRHFHVT
jgi:hypothetical protein